MSLPGFAAFDTAAGRCAVAWSAESALTGVRLPGRDDARAWPGIEEREPPPAVAAVIGRIRALLDGAADDLADVELDEAGVPDFHRRVYAVARSIGPGRTLTYGEVARALGEPGAAQAVGQALGRNPFPIVVPCHRVLAAGGASGGFSAPGGTATKLRLLALEGRPELAGTLPLFDA
ncbi:MAG TPA: methylated-DNA--[protein]-cysteine S-methyltransferase [Solirubrobacteraceae bacterium]|nr:methylated-DNA--[protein]-cysteine S-methyltransferase [Solirubrobacteraceae bacterium]